MKNTNPISRTLANIRPAALVVTMLLTVVLSGCSEIEVGGGSSVVPTVTVLPPDLSGDAVEGGAGSTAAIQDTAGAGGGSGTIRGRVVLSGTPPLIKPLYVAGADIKDKEVCSEVDVPDERLVIGADNGVANVFVYLKKKPKGTPALPPSEVALVFDQKNCRFLPHCMIIPTGQAVKVLSGDSIAHNTHTTSKRTAGVSSVVSPNDREGALQLVYNRPEAPVGVICDYHSWMKAYHLPLDHPYGAVTDENGNFEIADLPAGDHEFVVWHESASDEQYVVRKLPVTVKSGETTPLEIPYSVDALVEELQQ